MNYGSIKLMVRMDCLMVNCLQFVWRFVWHLQSKHALCMKWEFLSMLYNIHDPIPAKVVNPNKCRVKYKLSSLLSLLTLCHHPLSQTFSTSSEDKHSVAMKIVQQTVSYIPKVHVRTCTLGEMGVLEYAVQHAWSNSCKRINLNYSAE